MHCMNKRTDTGRGTMLGFGLMLLVISIGFVLSGQTNLLLVGSTALPGVFLCVMALYRKA